MSLGVAGGIAVEHFRPKNDPMEQLSGEWTTSIDITERVCANAEVWLEDIEGVMVTTSELEEIMGPLCVSLTENYHLDENGYAVCVRAISKESYEECEEKAYTAMSIALEKLIAARIFSAGLSEDVSDVSALFLEVFGMSSTEYLCQYGPELMPPYEKLNQEYTNADRK